MRYMALDVGDRRIGVAISDEDGRVAFPKDTLQRTGLQKDLERILAWAEREQVDEILVGMPLAMDGSEGPQAKKVTRFIKALRERTELSVTAWDERLTTVSAQRALLEADMSRSRRKAVVDKVAAALLLQGYLDYRQQMDAPETARS